VGEGRSNEFALLAVLFALAGEQAVAQERAGNDAQRGTFLEVIHAVDEDLLDEVWRVDQNDGAGTETDMANARDIGGAFFEHAKAVSENGLEDGLKVMEDCLHFFTISCKCFAERPRRKESQGLWDVLTKLDSSLWGVATGGVARSYNCRMDTRETFDRWHKGINPPIAQLIGFELTEYEKGRAVFSLEAGPRHANPMGTLHGGILCDVADAAMGTAVATTLQQGETFTTLELKINFLKPIWNAKLTAIGSVIRRGRVICLAECDVTDEKGSLVARASSTCMILAGEQAAGR
jgi:uncharacterized protein (TIGR00369 family)